MITETTTVDNTILINSSNHQMIKINWMERNCSIRLNEQTTKLGTLVT